MEKGPAKLWPLLLSDLSNKKAMILSLVQFVGVMSYVYDLIESPFLGNLTSLCLLDLPKLSTLALIAQQKRLYLDNNHVSLPLILKPRS
ncbi:hypothetical protein MRB53_023570 [Persea americana]|uniref:Uncharacterized protein n=1 Tax=Persea americana TaxID=3435 RepID=A0ACC2LA62_PERAE|nr:hypothetical protein MRB53_023570 [Persea americana]